MKAGPDRSNDMRFLLGLGLFSIAILAVEILSMRLLALLLWHHFAFFVIGAAMLGFSAAGLWLNLRGMDKEEAEKKTGLYMLVFVGVSAAMLAIWSVIPVRYVGVPWWNVAAKLALYFFSLFMPFFFGGVVVVMAFVRCEGRAGSVYFANMIGSGLGCWLTIAMLPLLGADRSMILALSLAGLSALICERGRWLNRIPAIIIVPIFTVSALTGIPHIDWWSSENKVLGSIRRLLPDQTLLYSKWDTNARIDVIPFNMPTAKVSQSTRDLLGIPEGMNHLVITIDGDAATYILNFSEGFRNTDFFKKMVYGAGYIAHKPKRVLVIGLGGALDIMAALKNGAQYIDGVDISRRMIEVVQDVFADKAENVYQDPRVHIHHSEGRSFVKRSRDKYDHIQMTGVDTWTALSSGAYMLSENYLYTKEAFADFLDRLEAGGTLTITRWRFLPPRECLRVCSTAVATLRSRGVKHPEHHFTVIRQLAFSAITIKTSPYTGEELAALSDRVNSVDTLKWVYRPGGTESNKFAAYFDAVARHEESSFIRNYRFNIKPTTDDSPFFFQYYRWNRLWSDLTKPGIRIRLRDVLPLGNLAIVGSTITSALFVAILLLVPAWLFGKRGSDGKSAVSAAIFFMGIGLGFMLVEIALMQKLVLFLGHPTLSVSVTLASLLCFAGLGSWWSGKKPALLRSRMLKVVLVLLVCMFFWGWAINPLLNALLGRPLWLRIIIAVLVIAPGALVMGVPFPSGLEAARKRDPALLPWGWALNGGASVMGSIAAIILAMTIGFSLVFLVAAIAYVCAAWGSRNMQSVE